MEFTGILAHSQQTQQVPMAVDFARQAELSGNTVLLVANGAGARRASAAVGAALSAFQPDAILSTGFAGALAPDLAVADIVTATSISDGPRRWPALPVSSARTHREGVVVSLDHIAQTAAEKRVLRTGGGTVVEMEAAGVAACAEARGIPFHCVRVVSDLAGEDMANDFNAVLREDGHFATIDLLIAVGRNPLLRLPELVRLRNRCTRAARVLGDFIADCRF
jgi:adenosylhomocysteine nucleosidase